MATITTPSKQNEDLGKKIQDTAHAAGDKARSLTEAATDKAKEAASAIGDKAEQATHAVGNRIESMGETLREKLPHTGVLGTASDKVASGLEASGRYIEEQGLKGMADDVTNMIRRNPIPALLAGVALGFLIARVTSRS